MVMDDRLLNLLSSLIRTGIVSTTNPENVTARVTFSDRDDVVGFDFRVLVKNTKENKDYWMPEVGEPVLCLCLPTGVEQGFILGSYYTKKTLPDANTADKRRTFFSDGTSVEHDRATKTTTINVPADGGKVVVNAHTSVTVNSPKIDLGQSAELEPSVLGDKLAAWITGTLKPYLDDHTHAPGTPYTSPAQGGSLGPFDPGSGASGGNVYSKKNRNQ